MDFSNSITSDGTKWFSTKCANKYSHKREFTNKSFISYNFNYFNYRNYQLLNIEVINISFSSSKTQMDNNTKAVLSKFTYLLKEINIHV